tara:strand:- start:67 stop:510 length:444 start_codon:yes stop_codon:yes gene_type:complete
MKKSAFLMLLVVSSYCRAFDSSVVLGDWAVYQENLMSEDYWYYLCIRQDYSGFLIRSFKNDPLRRNFSSKELVKHDGFIEIQLSNREKAVLSAWKLKSGSGRLTGQIFMYRENGELFNMLHFPLNLVKDGEPILKYEQISGLKRECR